MEIRIARPNDLPAIEQLLTSASQPTTDCKDHIDEFFVAIKDEELAATICLERCGDFALLRSLVVEQSFQHQKIGAQLVRHVIQIATSQSLKAIYLLCEQAETYFLNFGFMTVNRHHSPLVIQQTEQYSNLCPDSATLMHLELAGYS